MRLNDRLSLSDPNEAGPSHHLISQHVPGEKGCLSLFLPGGGVGGVGSGPAIDPW